MSSRDSDHQVSHSSDGTEHDQWRSHGEPLPTSAVRTDSGECAYGCGNTADYLVKAETTDGITAKTRVCQECSDDNRIWAERYLPPEVDRNE